MKLTFDSWKAGGGSLTSFSWISLSLYNGLRFISSCRNGVWLFYEGEISSPLRLTTFMKFFYSLQRERMFVFLANEETGCLFFGTVEICDVWSMEFTKEKCTAQIWWERGKGERRRWKKEQSRIDKNKVYESTSVIVGNNSQRYDLLYDTIFENSPSFSTLKKNSTKLIFL